MTYAIIDVVILLGLLLIIILQMGNNKKIDRLITKMKSEKKMTRKQVEKELVEINEIIKTN